MSDRRWTAVMALMIGLGLCASAGADAVARPSRQAITKRLTRMKERYERMGPAFRRELSSAALARLEFARRNWDRGDLLYDRMSAERTRRPEINAGSVVSAGKVNDPKTDIYFSLLGGNTQSQTSTAWCSPNVVVGFNDTGSFFESFFQSFSGYSRSTNNGSSFTDMGYLNPGEAFSSFVGGDPVLGCSDTNTFYNAQLWSYYYGTAYGISVSKSTNGGLTFQTPSLLSDPGIAALKGGTHFLDKEWMTAIPDPINPTDRTKDIIYVTYTDFDTTGTPCGTSSGFTIPTTSIELTTSTNGGATFSPPTVITPPLCPSAGGGGEGVQGSQVAVDKNGKVYVAWTHANFNLAFGEEQRVAKSTDGGATFPQNVKAADIFCWGNCVGGAQARFRSNEFSSLAVDTTTGLTGKSDNVYLAWSGNTVGPFVNLPFGLYDFADIEFARSTDGGLTWKGGNGVDPLSLVNTNIEPFPPGDPLDGRGTDQFFPAMAVDKSGTIGVCWYDRRRDVNNFKIDRFCGKSTNAGGTWSNTLKTARQFDVIKDQDGFWLFYPAPAADPFFSFDSYMGDYDSLSADHNKKLTGFLGAYSNNEAGQPDVKLNKP